MRNGACCIPIMPLVLALFLAITPLRAGAQSRDDETAELGPVPPPPQTEPHPIHDLVIEGRPTERGARPVGSFVAGAATVAAMVGVEVVGVLITTAGCDASLRITPCVEAAFAVSTTVAGAAALALVPLVVWATGQSLGGDGAYGWTFLGDLLGALAWALVPAVVALEVEDAILPAVLFAGVAQAAGATLGYELSTE